MPAFITTYFRSLYKCFKVSSHVHVCVFILCVVHMHVLGDGVHMKTKASESL